MSIDDARKRDIEFNRRLANEINKFWYLHNGSRANAKVDKARDYRGRGSPIYHIIISNMKNGMPSGGSAGRA